MSHFFAYINRMRYINRWALMRNSFTENIQEHSHQVAVLAHALAVIRNSVFGGCVDEGAAAVQTRAALDQMDLPELKYFCENFLGSFALTLDEME